MRKIAIAFLFFFVLISSLLLTSVKATDYEWINNAGFENVNLGVSNILVNSGFEYGNLTGWDSAYASIQATDVYNGSYSVRLDSASGYAFVNQTVNIVSDFIDSFGIYVSITQGSNIYMREKLCYSDGLYSERLILLSGAGFYEWNITSFPTGKIAVFAEFGIASGSGSPKINIDAAYLLSNQDSGQSDITWQTSPWYCYIDKDAYSGITNSEANSGSYSGYIITDSVDNWNRIIAQKINFLLTDNLTSISLYAKTNSATNLRPIMSLSYTDGTATTLGLLTGYTEINSTLGWTEIQYVLTYVPNGKLIHGIEIYAYSGISNSFLYIDDVSIVATVEDTGITNFNWYVVPEPFEYPSYDNMRFIGYVGQDYLFYGEFYDENGTLTYDGSFVVDMNYAAQESGSVINGQFDFPIYKRASILIGHIELIKITLVLPNGIFVFNIYATWSYSTNIPLPTPQGGGGGDFGGSINTLIYWVIYMFILFIPTVSFVFILRDTSISDSIKLILGFLLSAVISVLAGLDLWVLVVCIIAIGVILFGKREGYVS